MVELQRTGIIRKIKGALIRLSTGAVAMIATSACAAPEGPAAPETKQTVIASTEVMAEEPSIETKAPAVKTDARTNPLQLGLSFSAVWNLEEPFLNLALPSGKGWRVQLKNARLSERETETRGYTDRETGLPVKLPIDADNAFGPEMFRGASTFPEYYAGDYILEWDGDADVYLQGRHQRRGTKEGKNRIRYSIPATSPARGSLRATNLGKGGVTAIRFYRAEHEAAIKAGQLWNPDFLNYIARYDILRTMDLQQTNAIPARSFEDIARPGDPIIGRSYSRRWPAAARYGVPYEYLFDLAEKSGKPLWLHVPAEIGSPKDHAAPEFRRKGNDNIIEGDLIRAFAKTNTTTILNSPEWDRFASAFTDRLVASGYPTDRALYIELGNEVWNFAGPFYIFTQYAWGLGEGYRDGFKMREGYGLLTARWMQALENELAARDLSYNITYVVAGQTVRTRTTSEAYRGLKAFFKDRNIDPAPYVAKTGVAITSYHNPRKIYINHLLGKLDKKALVPTWEAAIKKDPEGLSRRLHDFILHSPDTVFLSRAAIIKHWRAHRDAAQKEGARFIGAYEGGSHDNPDRALMKSPIFVKWWREYHWGPDGADVVRQINLSLAKEFPDAILSNFSSIGLIEKSPWIDGHYAGRTPMMDMWEEFGDPNPRAPSAP